MNLLTHSWPLDMHDPIALVEWRFEKSERDDVKMLLATPLLAMHERLAELREWQIEAH